jgi:hypothetical protein
MDPKSIGIRSYKIQRTLIPNKLKFGRNIPYEIYLLEEQQDRILPKFKLIELLSIFRGESRGTC